jgi:hypothetical protein
MAAMLLVLRRRGGGLSRVSSRQWLVASLRALARPENPPSSTSRRPASASGPTKRSTPSRLWVTDPAGKGFRTWIGIEAATDVALKFAGVVLRLRAVEGAI